MLTSLIPFSTKPTTGHVHFTRVHEAGDLTPGGQYPQHGVGRALQPLERVGRLRVPRVSARTCAEDVGCRPGRKLILVGRHKRSVHRSLVIACDNLTISIAFLNKLVQVVELFLEFESVIHCDP